MAVTIRLARAGSKKRPSYRIVAADSRMPRDGRYLEKLGTYAPLLPKDSVDRVKMDVERVQHWLAQGAQVTDRIARMLEAAGLKTKAARANPKKGTPGKNADARVESKAAKVVAAAEAAAAPAPVPVVEEVVEATVADVAEVEAVAEAAEHEAAEVAKVEEVAEVAEVEAVAEVVEVEAVAAEAVAEVAVAEVAAEKPAAE